jgi:opacity protein-like surface antigen
MRLKIATAIIFLTASLPMFSQVAPSAYDRGQSPLSIGAGFSRINTDLGHGGLYGGKLWIDYSLRGLPPILHGLGVMMEAEDLDLNPGPRQSVLREDVALGGVSYTFTRFRNLHPYAKFASGLGNIDYKIGNNKTYHQSRTVTGMGAGLQYRAFRSVWVKCDYEYEYFPDFFLGTPQNPSSGSINPQGFTVGAMYSFKGRRSQERY